MEYRPRVGVTAHLTGRISAALTVRTESQSMWAALWVFAIDEDAGSS